jgi:uncharacterized protein
MMTNAPPRDPGRGDHAPVVLSRLECSTLLRTNHVGRVGFVVDGWPTILPVNYTMDGDDVVIRTGSGTKLSVLRAGAQVSFEVDGFEALYRSGWSVLIFGAAEEIADHSGLEHARSLQLRAWAAGPKSFWIRIRPVQVTGRRLPKAWQYPDPPSD